MPIARSRFRRRRTRPTRTAARRPRRFMRRRVRRLFPNNRSLARLNSSVMPKSLFVKMPVIYSFRVNLESTTPSRALLFQGNGIAPWTTAGQVGIPGGVGNVPDAATILPAGFSSYARLYNRYYVLASKFSIQAATIMPQDSIENVVLSNVRMLVAPITFDHFSDSSDSINNDSWQNKLDSLAALNDVSIMGFPGTRSQLLGPPGSAGSRWNMRMYRRTASMVGVKDVVDEADLSGYVKDTTDIAPASNTQLNPHHGFMYYVRCTNQNQGAEGDDVTVDLLVKMTMYVKFVDREDFVQNVANNIIPESYAGFPSMPIILNT